MNTSYLEMVATSCMGWTWCYFIEPVSEYLSGPSLLVEWTNWSKKNDQLLRYVYLSW